MFLPRSKLRQVKRLSRETCVCVGVGVEGKNQISTRILGDIVVVWEKRRSTAVHAYLEKACLSVSYANYVHSEAATA